MHRYRYPLAFVGFACHPGLASGAIVVSEFNSNPVTEGWIMEQQWCDPRVWTEDGIHHQQLDRHACPGSEVGGQDPYRWFLQSFVDHPNWFFEYRVSATGPRSEIPGGAPAGLAAGNAFGIIYHTIFASDQIKVSRDVDQPILFLDLEPGVMHTVRLELDNTVPQTYAWFIDGTLVDEGLADGPFPARDASIVWLGRSWRLPTFNQWDYIRFGDIPEDASGNFDSSDSVDLFDFYYFHECLTNERIGINGGPDMDAGPGCRWADFDADADVDLLDLAAFQNLFDPGH